MPIRRRWFVVPICAALCVIVTLLLFGPLLVWMFTGDTITLIDNLGTLDAGVRYPSERLRLFEENWCSGEYDGEFSILDFRTHFDILRLRRTIQGYYAVVLGDGGEKLFIFLRHNMEISDCILTETPFLKREQAEPLIQTVSEDVFDGIELPHYVLSTGAPYVTFYYRDGIEVVLYTESVEIDGDASAMQGLASPKTFYFQQSDLMNTVVGGAFSCVNPPFPIILAVDRQNAALPSSAGSRADGYAIVTAGLLMSLLFASLNLHGLATASRTRKAVFGASDAKRYLRRWAPVYFADIPLFLLCFGVSLTHGYAVCMLLPFLYLAVVAAVESRKRFRSGEKRDRGCGE